MIDAMDLPDIDNPGILVSNHECVQSLQKAALSAPRDIEWLRKALARTLRQAAWQDRLDPHSGERVKYEAEEFLRFIRDPLPRGLETDPATIRALLRDYPQELVLFEQAIDRGRGAPPGNQNARRGEEETNPDNIRDCLPPDPSPHDRSQEPLAGTSAAYAIRRLARERPDLLEQVKTGELSPHRAMVEAGFRKVPTPLDLLRRAWAKASPAEREAFIDQIGRNGGEL